MRMFRCCRGVCQGLQLFLLLGLFWGCSAQAAITMNIDGREEPVEIFATVTDANGPVTGLTRADFRIREDGVTRTIDGFTAPETGPLSIVFVIDDSNSLGPDTISAAEQAVVDFIRSLELDDRVALIKFDSEIGDIYAETAGSSFLAVTDDERVTLIDGVNHPLSASGGSHVYDAMVRAVELLTSPANNLPEGPKSIVLLSDGKDEGPDGEAAGSTSTLTDVLNRIDQENVRVITVGYGDADTTVLTPIAEAGGSEYYGAGDPQALEQIKNQITSLFRNSYLISYASGPISCPSPDITLELTVFPLGQTQTEVFNRCNRAPVIESITRQKFERGVRMTFRVVAHDPDGDPLSFSATGLPTGLTLDGQTGVISGVPENLGTYNVQVTVSDGRSSSHVAFTADVVNERYNDSGGGGTSGPWGLLLLAILVALRRVGRVMVRF